VPASPLVPLPLGNREVVRPLSAGFRPLHGAWEAGSRTQRRLPVRERGAVTRVDASMARNGRRPGVGIVEVHDAEAGTVCSIVQLSCAAKPAKPAKPATPGTPAGQR
jgi:hypothetical protein